MHQFLRKIINNRLASAFLIGILISVIITTAFFSGLFESMNRKMQDKQYTLNEASKDIVIIGIDAASTEAQPKGLGRYSEWSRENYTKLLEVLKKEDPKVITFDILFNKPTENIPLEKISTFKSSLSENLSQDEKLKAYDDFMKKNSDPLRNPIDEAFAAKLEEFNNVVLPFVVSGKDSLIPLYPLKKFSKTAALGNFFTQIDPDGILRRTQPFYKDGTTDFAVQTAMKYLNISDPKKLRIPTENSQMNVNFFAPPFGYKMISFVDVLNGKYAANTFKNKIVLIGVTSLKQNEDRFLTPRDNSSPMPGVEFRANEIQTIIEGKFLMNQGRVSVMLTIAAISIGLAIALNYLGIALSVLVTFAVFLLYIATIHLLYRSGLLLNILYPCLAIFFTYLASWIYKYFIADRKKREITSAFGHYVSSELVEQISQNPDLVKLGGEKKIVTVFFSDIKDSTALSEKTPIEIWVSQINEYFTEMENVVKKSGGTLDKYEGDAVMAFWNAPLPQEDHVFRAYACAIGMRNALARLHEKWAQEGKPLIDIRIGINTGEALVGNFGSAGRFDYTVMGYTVNTASRLESAANKAYGTSTIVAGIANVTESESAEADSAKASPVTLSQNLSANSSPREDSSSSANMYAQCAHTIFNAFTIRELDTVYLPGKKEPVKLYELLGLASETTEETHKLLKTYAQALAAYRCQDFATAITSLTTIQSTDGPAQILLARCQKLQKCGIIQELDNQMIYKIQNK